MNILQLLQPLYCTVYAFIAYMYYVTEQAIFFKQNKVLATKNML